MRTDLDFKKFYNDQLVPELEIVEKKRYAILFQLAITSVIVLGFFSAYIYTFAVIWKGPQVLLVYIPTFLLVLLAAYKTFGIIIKNTSFYDYFKKNIIFKTILYMNPALRFDKKYFISKDQFFNSEIFKEEKVKYKGDDYVTGNLEEDVVIEFSELNIKFAEKDTIRNKKSDTMFSGIFYKARLPFIFPINFVIEPLDFNNGKENGIIYKTNNIDFDNRFQIRILKKSSDYNPSLVLTDEFLNGIVSFSQKFLNEVHISFIENNIYSAIHHDKELFEPLVFKGNKKFDLIYRHYQDLSFPINLIKNIIINQEIEDLAA